ncbi:MAG: dihydrodipicolinate synthase family protein [Solirubrobacterales bacterium]|nr:dihydrodipicolinate synthase family protein [Solirubrobacterales bacterium]
MTISRSDRKAWAREHFVGAENILLPSFTPELRELDEAGIRLDVGQSIAHGVFSIFCAIESGLTYEEKVRFLEITVEEAAGRVCVGFPLQGDSVEENIELLQQAERIGASHAMVSYPQNLPLTDADALVRYHEQLIEASDLALVLFHNDKFALHHLHPSGLPVSVYDRIVDRDTVVAIKVSVMDWATLGLCFARYAGKLLVSTPTILQLPLAMTHYDMQWTGAWTIEAFQTPEQPLVIELLDALRAGRHEEAIGIFARLGPLLAAFGPRLARMMPSGTYHWTFFKYLQYLSGGNGGVTRPPAMRLTRADMQEIRGAFLACGLTPAEGGDEEFAHGRSAARAEAVA